MLVVTQKRTMSRIYLIPELCKLTGMYIDCLEQSLIVATAPRE